MNVVAQEVISESIFRDESESGIRLSSLHLDFEIFDVSRPKKIFPRIYRQIDVTSYASCSKTKSRRAVNYLPHKTFFCKRIQVLEH